VSKNAKGQGWKERSGRRVAIAGAVGEALYETVIGAGLACVNEVLEAERIRLCGARYQHQSERQALRGGHVAS
jgi:hypothetical protein